MFSLTNILKVNALSSGATGLLLLFFARQTAALFNVATTAPFIEAGLFLVLFAAFVWIVSTRRPHPRRAVSFIIGLDLLWVIASVIALPFLAPVISGTGITLIALVAAWVALMALLQRKGAAGLIRPQTALLLVLFCLSGTGSLQAQTPARPPVAGQEPAAVVQAFLQAVQELSHAKAAPLVHDSIRWEQPGSNRFSGSKSGAAAVFGMFRGMIDHTDNHLSLAGVRLVAVNGSSVACWLHWKGTDRSGKQLDVENIDVYTVQSGKIIQAVVYSADLAAEDRFWGR
ncbi:MAG TPA: nuclear transport factor 2 family protein [Chitinophagaceae bacterium]|jgi:hypothetical protein|nr:nuclear transport factor 2 family protein [Chitinophagaceae bacterium]